MTLDEIRAQAESAKELASKATHGPGFIGHCPIDDRSYKNILDAFKESLDKSIAHDSKLEFYWIETDTNLTIGYFGNGPTSQANADLWAKARLLVPDQAETILRLCSAIEKLREQRYELISCIAQDPFIAIPPSEKVMDAEIERILQEGTK